jgi:hypothetical protein
VALRFIGASVDSVMIHFPPKKMSFYFNYPCDPNAGSRSQKVGSLKYFKVCSILKKEPVSIEQKSYQSDRHGYLPKM